MPKLTKKAGQAAVADRMSAWIRLHSEHLIVITHKVLSGNVDGEYERFLCFCSTCNNQDIFYYIVGKPREKKPSCKECKV